MRAAAVGMPVPAPGGVVVEGAPAWGATAAGETPEGVALMQQAFGIANDCFMPRFSVDPLSGADDGWSVVVDAAIGPDGGLGPAVVQGISVDDELACLADGLATLASPSSLGLTFRITSPTPRPPLGDARVELHVDTSDDDPIARVRARRFELRAEDVALACAARTGAPPSGSYSGDGGSLLGTPPSFADCWADLAPALEAWTDRSSAFTLDYTAPR